MKLYEILENPNELSPIIEKIKRDCKPFLSVAKDSPMMRGVTLEDRNAKLPLFSEETVRMDRQPRNSGKRPYFNWVFNAVIEEKFKIKKVRNTSLFCTGGIGSAQYYGHPAFIFPKGAFKYLWSPSIEDSMDQITSLTTHCVHYKNEIPKNEFFKDLGVWRDEVAEPFFYDLIDSEDFKTDAILRLDHPIADFIYKNMFKDFDRYKQTGLREALKTGNEIFILGPQDYYQVSIDVLGMLLDRKNHYHRDIYKDFLGLFSV